MDYKFNNIHIKLSPFLFISCLFFPGYYIGTEPQLAILILLFGWVGMFFGYFYWLANVFYLIALINYKNTGYSGMLGLISLLLALSFIWNKKILVNAGIPSYSEIAQYGIGFYLWIASISLFTLGQIIKNIFNTKRKDNMESKDSS